MINMWNSRQKQRQRNKQLMKTTLNAHMSCLSFLGVQSTVPANKSYILTKIIYIYVSVCLMNTGGSNGKELAYNVGELRKETQGEHKIWKTFHFYNLHKFDNFISHHAVSKILPKTAVSSLSFIPCKTLLSDHNVEIPVGHNMSLSSSVRT